MRGDRNHDQAAVEIADLTDADIPGALSALHDAFGEGFDREWFEWKHRSGPWGKSPGWVATDDDGLIGVRLFLPWRFRGGGDEFRALRPCDTVTVPRARGRGVFRKLTEHAISNSSTQIDFVFNTPNEQSKPGYLKMGFSEWTRVGQRLGLVSPKPASLTEEVLLPNDDLPEPATERTAAFFDWRYRQCPIYDYRLLSLNESEGPNGIVCRLRSWRRQNVMIVDECWGGPDQEKALVRATARSMGARLVWTTDRLAHVSLFSWSRGATDVTTYAMGERAPVGPSFSVGDIESVL